MQSEQENGTEKLSGGDMHLKHGKLWHWFDNFWYHYKWHTIFALTGLFIILFCTLSMCGREDPDYFFYYGGQGEFSGDQQKAIVSALNRECSRVDGADRDTSITFTFLMTNDQVSAFNAENQGTGYAINSSLLLSNRDLFSDEILTGNSIIMFLDEDVLAETQASSNAFLAIRDFAPAGTPDEAFSGEYGIYLDYTIFANDEAFDVFPEGTVIAIRNGISALSIFQREKALENRERYEKLLKDWLTIH